MPSSCPAASLMATTCVAGHRQVFAGDEGRAPVRRRWRAGTGRMQRLPDSGGSRVASRRADPHRGLKFICREVRLTVETADSPFTSAGGRGTTLRLPSRTAKAATSPTSGPSMNWRPRTASPFRYDGNPNGSLRDIAGILSRERQRHGDDAASRARHRAAYGFERRLTVFQSMLGAAGARMSIANYPRTGGATPVEPGGVPQDRGHSGPRTQLHRARHLQR